MSNALITRLMQSVNVFMYISRHVHVNKFDVKL